MAKKELIRKVLATAVTVLTLSCGLGLCIWLLFSSSMFGAALRWTMLVCSVVLGGAIVGLLISKVQEIRALAEIVRLDAQLPAQPPAHEAETPAAEPADAQPQPPAPEPEHKEDDPPVNPVNAVPLSVVPGAPAPDPQAEHRSWKPINFSAVDRETQAKLAQRQQELEAAQAAEAARVKAEADAQRQRAERQAREQAEQLRLAEEARMQAQREAEAAAARQAQEAQARQAAKKATLVEQAKRTEEARRAEQLRLADAARTGQIPQITDQLIAAEEARLAELARKAEAERLAKLRQAGGTVPQAAPVRPAPPRAVPPAANPTPAQPVWQAVAFDGPAQPPKEAPLQVDVPKTAAEEPHKLNVKPISWPAPPPPSKLYATGAIPKVTPDMVAAEQAKQAAAGDSWQKSH